MADTPNLPAPTKPGLLARFGLSRKRWASTHVAPVKEIDQSDTYLYGAGTTTVASLLGSGNRGARSRQIIYEKWMRMEGDPIISSALQLLVTSALGGHETSGDLVFVEKTVQAKKNKRLATITDDIAADLTPLFNRVAFQMAYTGAAYGDSYARIYTDARGVVDLHSDEMVRPQLVQPFERGSRTIGFAVSLGERNFERLDVSQLARLKMPRTQWIPQFGVVEKSLKGAITENDIDNLPIMPSMVGGSLLYNAEEPYDNLTASLLGLVGQRWMDSIDEQMVAVNLESMTQEQQERFVESVKGMLLTSKHYAEQAVKRGRPIMERIRHIIPIFNEKQLTNIGPGNGGQTGRAATISIDDVLLHARLLSGALGVDLSMLGFADQLSGGLGEGGFFRVSAQAAERARVIRVALAEFFNHVIDIHTYHRYGVVFNVKERPWEINFFGSISALEAEKQRTRADSMNGGMLLVQAMQMLKEIGASKDIMTEFLAKTMLLDEDQAKLYAAIVDAKPRDEGGGFGGGGFGGGGNGGGLDSVLDAVALDGVPDTNLGPVFTEYENDPEGAIERLLSERTGDARAVWTRQGLGTIDLVWGSPKGGIMHIAQKHPEVLSKLPRILKTGKIYRTPGGGKVFLVMEGNPPEVAVIALDWYGRAKTWVVTSYKDERGVFTGGIKTIDPDALDSTKGGVLSGDQRTAFILDQDTPGFNDDTDWFGGGGGGGGLDGVAWAAFDSVPERKGVIANIPVPNKTVAWLGFSGAMTLRADLWTLQGKHPEYFHDADSLLSAIQFVMDAPDDWFIHKDARVSIFRKRADDYPLVRIELEKRGGGFVVRSVYASNEAQIAHKLNAKQKELERLSRSGKSYGSLTVAEYLSMLGSGSSRPVPPSGGHPKPQ